MRPLHVNLQGANFQRCQCVCVSSQASQFTRLVPAGSCTHPPEAAGLLCASLCTSVQSGLPWRPSGKGSACQCRRQGFDPWSGKITWRRKWQLTPVFLPGKFHGQRSLVSYSPWGAKSWTPLSTHSTAQHYHI